MPQLTIDGQNLPEILLRILSTRSIHTVQKIAFGGLIFAKKNLANFVSVNLKKMSIHLTLFNMMTTTEFGNFYLTALSE